MRETVWDRDLAGPGLVTTWDRDLAGPGERTIWDPLPDLIGRTVRLHVLPRISRVRMGARITRLYIRAKRGSRS